MVSFYNRLHGIAFCFLLGCCDASEPTALLPTDSQLRARALVSFESVDMYKPVASERADLDVYHAPIFYREHPAEARSIDQALEFGALNLRGGQLALDVQRPTVYTHRSSVVQAGMEHEQIIFLWFRVQGTRLAAQGLRLTYGADGFPAIYEVLGDSSGRTLFFVSRALELLAGEVLGDPIEGRLYAVEPSPLERPDVLVVRTVSQGAEPLGPLVYDEHGSSDVIQLHCRCAPSQLKAIGASVSYELVDVEQLPENLRRQLAVEMGWGDAATDLGFPDPTWPLTSLRLPDVF